MLRQETASPRNLAHLPVSSQTRWSSPRLDARVPDAPGIEVRDLEEDVGCRLRHLAVVAPHDAGNRLRPLCVGDDDHEIAQRSLDAIERGAQSALQDMDIFLDAAPVRNELPGG